jgi:hypothetical protein
VLRFSLQLLRLSSLTLSKSIDFTKENTTGTFV